MGRYYHISKKLSDDQAAKIMREMEAIDDVEDVMISDDHKSLFVKAKNDEFQDVMHRAVNIFSRIAQAEVSFDRFEIENA